MITFFRNKFFLTEEIVMDTSLLTASSRLSSFTGVQNITQFFGHIISDKLSLMRQQFGDVYSIQGKIRQDSLLQRKLWIKLFLIRLKTYPEIHSALKKKHKVLTQLMLFVPFILFFMFLFL